MLFELCFDHMRQFLVKPLTLATLTLTAIAGIADGRAQVLNWTKPQQTFPSVSIGGQPSREALSAVVFKGMLYVAYLGQQVADAEGNKQVFISKSSIGGSLSTPVAITTRLDGLATGINNPVMAVWDDKLYVVYTYQYGAAHRSTTLYTYTADGSVWADQIGGFSLDTINSPSVTVFNDSLYVAMTKTSDSSVYLCSIQPSTAPVPGAVHCENFVNNKVNFNPSLSTFNNRLYLAYANQSNDHQMWLLYYDNRTQTWTTSSVLTGNSSSTPPAFNVHNGALYLGFRTNDGDHKFLYQYSTDGISFSEPFDPHYTMGGYPYLSDLSSIADPQYSGYLLNIFSSNDGTHTIYHSLGK